MRFMILAGAAAVLCPTAEAAVPALDRTERAAPVQGADPGEYAAAMSAYGEWIVRLVEMQAPLHAGFAGLQAQWEAVQRGRDPEALARFRASVNEIAARLDAMHSELSTMSGPDVSLIDLPAELAPAAMIDELIRVNRGLRTAVATFVPAADAVASGDGAAAESAVRRMLESVGVVLESQVATSRAMLSVASPEGADWEIANIEHLYFRAAARTFRAWPHLLEGRADPNLAGELVQIAAELESTADAGATKNQAELAAIRLDLEAVDDDPDPMVQALGQQTVAAFEAAERIFPLARRLAAGIRTAVSGLDGRRGDIRSVNLLFAHLGEFRRDYEAALAAMGAAMAALR